MNTIQNYVNGTTVPPAHDTPTIDVVDPRVAKVVGTQTDSGEFEVARAVESASNAFISWSLLDPSERIRMVRRACQRLHERSHELVALEVLEMGKPEELARQGVTAAIDDLLAACDLYEEFEHSTVAGKQEDGSYTEIRRLPLGATAVITPWNYPVTTALFGLGHLLLAGNTVVLKPSEKSPSAPRLAAELMQLPSGVVNVVLGGGRAGSALVAHPGIQLVHFTGSVATGRSIARSCADKLIRCVLELGGKDPVFVDAQTDVSRAAEAVAVGSYLNSGQICTSMERVYVHEAIANEFIEKLVQVTRDQWTNVPGKEVLGPLVDEHQLTIVEDHLSDAVAKGAQVLAGGARQGEGFFFPATVVVGVTDDMDIAHKETFGPLACIQVVTDMGEAFERARQSSFGLGATVYSDDKSVQELASQIPAALVWINEWQGSWTHREYEPWGESGVGPTGGMAAFGMGTRAVSVFHAGTRASA